MLTERARTNNNGAADMLLSFAHTTVPGLSHQAMLRLYFGQELDETDQLATLNILATGLTTSGRPGQTRTLCSIRRREQI
jgi:hypothetical protein